jgi:hypothetical protein
MKSVLLKSLTCLFIFASFLFTTGCKEKVPEKSKEQLDREKYLIQHPIEHFEDTSTFFPVEDRIQPLPYFLKRKWEIIDERDNYIPYKPTNDEIDLIVEYIELLPDIQKYIIQEFVVGIFLLENFKTAGLADWIPFTPDPNNPRYFIVLDKSVLEMGMSEGMTKKLNTAFDQNPNLNIKVVANSSHKYLLYILMHEAFHLIDYKYCLTPYIDKPENPDNFTHKPFTENVWTSYSVPKVDFPYQSKINFYQLQDKAPIPLSEANTAYKELSNTPFPSLYASLNWAEDFAECMTYYHLKEKMGINIEIQISENESAIANFKPLDNTLYQNRALPIRFIYSYSSTESN